MCKSMQIHATMVVCNGQGVLLKGASGSGKSDLALRLITNKRARLVADDVVDLYEKDGKILGTAPQNLQGLLEIRGVGIVKYPFINDSPISLVVNLVASDKVERMPKNEYENILGVEIPKIDLYASGECIFCIVCVHGYDDVKQWLESINDKFKTDNH